MKRFPHCSHCQLHCLHSFAKTISYFVVSFRLCVIYASSQHLRGISACVQLFCNIVVCTGLLAFFFHATDYSDDLRSIDSCGLMTIIHEGKIAIQL